MNARTRADRYAASCRSNPIVIVEATAVVRRDAYLVGFREALELAADLGKHIGCEMDSRCKTCKYVDAIRCLAADEPGSGAV